MENECKICHTEMITQSFIDPVTKDQVEQLQCCKCGFSQPKN